MHIIKLLTLIISTTCGALSRFNLWSSDIKNMDAIFNNLGIWKKVQVESHIACVLQCQLYFSQGCGINAVTRQCHIYKLGGNTRWKPQEDFHFFIPLSENSIISWTDMRRSGHNFALLLSKTKQRWAESRTLCGNLGSRLYEMDATEKKEAVKLFLRGKDLEVDERIWMGLSDIKTEGKWFWESGKKVDDNVWAPNEPNNMLNGQDCGYLRDDFLVDDIECSSTLRCICELVYPAI